MITIDVRSDASNFDAVAHTDRVIASDDPAH
jgi:hypothetical protein